MQSMVLLGDKTQVEARFGPFGDIANIDATEVHVYAERIIGSEINLDVTDGTPR
jgi:hypothetical protein